MSTIKDIINLLFAEAVQSGRLDIVKYLVENGADILSIQKQSLRLAIVFKYDNVIRYLFDEEPKLNKHCSELISVAIKVGSNEIKEFLKRRLESESNKSRTINFLLDV